MAGSKFGESRVSDNPNGIFAASREDGVSAEYASNLQQRINTMLETVRKASALKPADADYTKVVSLLENCSNAVGVALGNEQKQKLDVSSLQDSDDAIPSAPSLS